MHPTKDLPKRLFAITSALSPHCGRRVFIACGPAFLRNVTADLTDTAGCFDDIDFSFMGVTR